MTGLPLLPAEVITFDGQLILLNTSTWMCRTNVDGGNLVRLSWERLQNLGVFDEEFIHIVKLYLYHRLQRKMTSTVSADLYAFQLLGVFLQGQRRKHNSLFRAIDYDEPTAQSFLRWCLHNSLHKGNSFSRLRVFYSWGIAHQVPGFNPHTLSSLKSIMAPGNSKGHHVRSLDPLVGPFSSDELRLISGALALELGTPCNRAIVMLHLELGCNPTALVRLQNRDLKVIHTPSGQLYQLDVPRLKKRTGNRDTKRRSISRQLGTLLQALQTGTSEDPLLHWLHGTGPVSQMYESMKRWVKEASIISPRTKTHLQINPRRFRYTLATHLAEEGASKFHIAEILDHSDLQNVNVYVETTSRIADEIAKATDPVVRPLVDRFLGRIVDNLDNPAFPELPTNSVIPASAPHLPLLSVGGVGVCGRNVRKDGLCKLLPPLSCYLCPMFAALRTGPHQEILNSIDEYIDTNHELSDVRILQQLTDIRAAIAEVLNRIGGDP